MSTTALHKYINTYSINGQLQCRFVILTIQNTNTILPCGCGLDDSENELILLHFGNTLYCCGKQIRRIPQECHATIDLTAIQDQPIQIDFSNQIH